MYAEASVKLRLEEIVVELEEILEFLLPLSKDKIGETATEIITEAVKLKTAMTEELAVYKCFWIPFSQKYEQNCIEATEDEPCGVAVFCIFPGLHRKIRKEGKTRSVCVVKAKGVFQNAFTEPE
jgi:hypothetical protein